VIQSASASCEQHQF